MSAEWFRKSTWTESDRDDFFAHLGEYENQFHKAQYLRIQALHLQDIGTPAMLLAALELLDFMLKEAPHQSQLSAAHLQRAECLDGLDRADEAVQAYRDALDAQRSFPKAQTAAPLSFGMFAILRERTDLYGEVEAALDEFPREEMPPEEGYQYAAVRAIIADYRGDTEKARECAWEAINAAQGSYAGTHYDKSYLGLVNKPDTGLHEKISELAGLK